MTGSKGKPRTPPDLMSELLGSLQEDVPLPGERPSEPAESTEQQVNKSTSQQISKSANQHNARPTEQLVDFSTSRLVDLSARPQAIKTKIRKRDGAELTRKTHYLTPVQVRLLKEYAFMIDQGESEVVRQALDEFFARHGHSIWSND
jgi:hypothetical protein